MLSGIRRLSLKQSSWCVLSRHLSSAQTKAALKPFYFAVHPDLFGQYPIQRSINEDSLKRLNSYLEDLQTKKPVNPTHLMFYLKNDTATSLEEGRLTCVTPTSEKLLVLNTVCGDGTTGIAKRKQEFLVGL